MRKAYPNEIFHAARRINSAYDANKFVNERIKEKDRRRKARGGSGEAYEYYKRTTNRVTKPGKTYYGYDITKEDYDRLVDKVASGEMTAKQAVLDYWERAGKPRYDSDEDWLIRQIEVDATMHRQNRNGYKVTTEHY